ncbi:MAG: hypothetical protein US22_C0061G0002 [candidate division TM6 bacterium GW2011_GWF2_36_6]|nr:MAG: hypothetical protein US22_C0061G0002 [candidate division TM6 bacterium GW2011_GWF2_36_6]
MKKLFRALPFLFLIFMGCGDKKSKLLNVFDQSKEQGVKNYKIHNVFIFIHGTIIPYPSPVSLFDSIKNTLKSGRRDKISWEERFFNDLRFKSIYKYQPIQEYGLQPINLAPITPNSPYYYSFVTAVLFQNVLNSIDPEFYSDSSFYTFGWDGWLSNQSRIDNAKILYQSLFDLVQKLKTCYENVNITILAHSHGGNVALNLANAYNELKSDLLIDKLVLIGTPVQSETSKFILSPIFKKIYSFYSDSDMVQIIDVLSTQDSVSKRRFKNITPLQNIVQVELIVGQKHPGHNELWLFGDTFNWLYRHKLATYPLPIFMFIPTILNFIEKDLPGGRDLRVTIDKKDEKFTLSFKDKDRKDVQKNTFLPASLLIY